MSRSIAVAFNETETEQPTRRLQAFNLPEEARRVEEHGRGLAASGRTDDDDATLNVAPEETAKLLASVFGLGQERPRSTDDEPTLDAPSPVGPPSGTRVSARAPALRALVLTPPPSPARSSSRLAVAPVAVVTSACAPEPNAIPVRFTTPIPPPPVVTAPESGWRRKVEPQLAQAARSSREDEERRRGATTFTLHLPKPTTQNFVVAGIWATALSLFAVLMVMASAA